MGAFSNFPMLSPLRGRTKPISGKDGGHCAVPKASPGHLQLVVEDISRWFNMKEHVFLN